MFQSGNIYLTVFPAPGFPDSFRLHISHLHPFVRNANGSDPWSKFFQLQLPKSLSSFGMLCNTAEDIEPLGLDILRKYTKLPVWCIGPLLPPQILIKKPSSDSRILGQHSGREPGLPTEKCMEWLDKHGGKNSVLYISFGSQNTISLSRMLALAMGLEESGKPFIWCIRPPIGFDLKGEFRSSEWLPQGFEKRVTGKGLIVHGWAPQLDILCHKSIGAFLSHCGWNSVMESLSQGVPIIGWPLAGEQGYNSKMLMENLGVSVELCRGTQSDLGKDEVKRVVDIVLGGEKGEEMRKKANEIGDLIRKAVGDHDKGSSTMAINDFVTVMLSQNKGCW